MKRSHIQQVADAILYEGYILYPYRPSAIKNRQRWSFGGLCPRSYSEAQRGTELWRSQTECLTRTNGRATISLKVRFLHLVQRQLFEVQHPARNLSECFDGEFHAVQTMKTNGKSFHSWQEAVEREIDVPPFLVSNAETKPESFVFHMPASSSEEAIYDSETQDRKIAGKIVREQNSLDGRVEVNITDLGQSVFRVSVGISNTTPLDNADQLTRDEVMMHSLVSTHMILTVAQGQFISLLDPPKELAEAAGQCRNMGLYPVLVGEKDDATAMLSSPVILYDHPEIAPESAGNLFDSTEIDEILTLRVMTLSDAEKEEMCSADERARELLHRVESNPAHLGQLHGVMRPGAPNSVAKGDPLQTLESFEQELEPLKSVLVAGKELHVGERVRLQPNRLADIMDIALNGKSAVIESIEQDYEGRVHLGVVIEDDPGRDLGVLRQPGHRFFFSPDEVHPL